MKEQTKENKVSKPFLFCYGLSAISIIGITALTFQLYKTERLHDTQRNLLLNRIEILENDYRFHSKSQFEKTVKSTLEGFVEEKRLANIKHKNSMFEAAAEQTPEGKHIYGNINARFTLVEFSDLECPYCKKFHDTPKEIVDASKGNVNWQWKHLPLSFHNPAAEREAIAAECVAEQKGNRAFWVFINEVFQLSKGNGAGVENLADVAEGIGVDSKELRNCLVSGHQKARVAADMQQARENGISGTPATFVVDNETGKTQLLQGAQPSQAIVAVIRKMMAESNSK